MRVGMVLQSLQMPKWLDHEGREHALREGHPIDRTVTCIPRIVDRVVRFCHKVGPAPQEVNEQHDLRFVQDLRIL